MFHNYSTVEEDNLSEHLPHLVSRISRKSYIDQRLSEIGTQTPDEELNVPNFLNLKFQNIFNLNKKTVEKKIIFSKINIKQDLKTKDKLEKNLPEINEGNSINIDLSSAKSSKKFKSHHKRNLSTFSIFTKPLPNKEKFKTTLDYYKYLIEQNENNRRLSTNFMVKDHFLIFSEKMKQNNNHEILLNSYINKKEVSSYTTVKGNKKISKSLIPDLKYKNLELGLNHNRKNVHLCREINTFNKSEKYIKNFEVEDKSTPIEKVRNILESRKKKNHIKIKCFKAEIK
jgi:hypothetical protein